MSVLLEVKNLKVHFPVKHGMFSRVRVFAALTPNRIALNFPA
jgi:ABC-type oligopeptide transport system ATPase subunit